MISIRSMVEKFKDQEVLSCHQEKARTITVILEIHSFGKRWQLWQNVDALASLMRTAGIRFKMYACIGMEDMPATHSISSAVELEPTLDFRGAYRDA